jgi:hypothetical protein
VIVTGGLRGTPDGQLVDTKEQPNDLVIRVPNL